MDEDAVITFVMQLILAFVFFVLTSTATFGQVAPKTLGTLSTTHLLSVERLVPGDPNLGPDGLLFCFLVASKPPAEHKFGIKQTEDFKVNGESYEAITKRELGKNFTHLTTVHDVEKYLAENPKIANLVSKITPNSRLIITALISGAPLNDGENVELVFHIGFGRTTDEPEIEDLIFTTKVPRR